MDAADLAFTPLVRQAELVRKGEVSPRELVETYLSRIDRLDPQLNAWRVVFAERALAEAEQATGRLKAGDERPLLGVPVAIKDNVDVAGDVTTHGTRAHGGPAREDCEVVRRVRSAGAIVLGRTLVPPLCSTAATESPTFGMSRNPWDPSRSPGGSSGGSAAAVAAGMVGGALGSDGGGSIRTPAAFCGLFGLKPQRGRVPLSPLPDHWHGMSVLGWITRTVADSALLLDLTMGPGPADRDRAPSPPKPFADAAATPPGKLRIAYSFAGSPGTVVRLRDEVRAGVLETAEALRGLGHDVFERDPDAPPRLGAEGTAASLARVMRGIADEADTLPHPERLDLRWKRWRRAGSLIPLSAVRSAREAGERVGAFIEERYRDCDAILAPVAPEPPIEVGRWEGRGLLWTLNGNSALIAYTAPWNLTGQPAAAVPAGFTPAGLPLSVQVIGRRDDEGTVLSLAAQLEAERPWTERRPPVS